LGRSWQFRFGKISASHPLPPPLRLFGIIGLGGNSPQNIERVRVPRKILLNKDLGAVEAGKMGFGGGKLRKIENAENKSQVEPAHCGGGDLVTLARDKQPTAR
jgi:hypothetical protein